MLGPILCLIVSYAIGLYIYRDPIVPTPCQGVCDITPEMVAASPAGCKPENPFQLFYPHIPKTAGTTMHQLIMSRRHLKEFEVVPVREWRDAVPGGVVWLPPPLKKKTDAHSYEAMYRIWVSDAVMRYKRAHRSVFFGHVFFHNFSEPLNQSYTDPTPYKLRHEIRGVTLLRDPIRRLASQYTFDRNRAKSTEFQAQVRAQQGTLSFEECAGSDQCRRANEFPRWCSLQTRYICGWGPDCVVGKDGGATPKMLARAKVHLSELFAVVGVQEQWDRFLQVLAAKLPTYFEGLSAEYREGNVENCGVGPRHWYQKRIKKERCPYTQNTLKQFGAQYSVPAQDSPGGAALSKDCWADIELYQHAMSLFETQAAACSVDRPVQDGMRDGTHL